MTQLPQLGHDIALALDGIEAALVPFVTASRQYDQFVESAVHRLQKVAAPVEVTHEAGSGLTTYRRGGTAASPFVAGAAETSPAPVPAAPVVRSRVSLPRHGHPTVDGVPVSSCRGPSQLAAIVCPIFEQLGAHHGLIEALRLLAAGAPQLPS